MTIIMSVENRANVMGHLSPLIQQKMNTIALQCVIRQADVNITLTIPILTYAWLILPAQVSQQAAQIVSQEWLHVAILIQVG